MPVSQSTVEAIFRRLLARYGAAWRLKWAGVPEADVKADWLHVLGPLPEHAIRHGLEHLPPEFPPTAHQFREVCLRAPALPSEQLALDAPKPDLPRLKAELERLHSMLKDRPPKQWAYDLQEREAKGEPLTDPQRKAWREALATADEPLQTGSYTFLDEELPPKMRKGDVDQADVTKLEQHVRAMLYGSRAPDPSPRARFSAEVQR